MRRVAFAELRTADLVVDAVYESDAERQNVAADPIAPLTGTGNMGGFRFSGSVTRPNMVVLYTTMGEPNWPGAIDQENGLLVYFGDTRKPGFELHDRRAGRGGNGILRDAFERAHLDAGTRAEVPPFLVFSKAAPRGGT